MLAKYLLASLTTTFPLSDRKTGKHLIEWSSYLIYTDF